MGRKAGVRNPDYEVRRQGLLDAATDYVLSPDVISPSLRQISFAVGASEPTIKHYFGGRAGLVSEVLANVGKRCTAWREQLRQGFPDVRQAIEDFARVSDSIPENSMLVQANLFALRESLSEPSVFQDYVDFVVEPNIEALAMRLQRSRGGPRNFANARAAAGMIVSNLSMISLRRVMLAGGDKVAMSVEDRVALTMHWICEGFLNDADGEGLNAHPKAA